MGASVPAGGNAGRLLPGGVRWFCGFRRRGLALACRRPLFRIGGVLALIGEARQIAEVVHREQGLDGLVAGGAIAAFGGRIGFGGQFLVVLLRDQLAGHLPVFHLASLWTAFLFPEAIGPVADAPFKLLLAIEVLVALPVTHLRPQTKVAAGRLAPAGEGLTRCMLLLVSPGHRVMPHRHLL